MNNIENRTLYFGDNLNILQEKITDESIDLIYLDPPFNSKRNYNMIYKDSNAQQQAFLDTWVWDSSAIQEYNDIINNRNNYNNLKLIQLIESLKNLLYTEGNKNGNIAYLIKMTSRLIELKRVLKPTGSIYLHCDPTASHYLKIVMDIIFGEENFRNEIVWCYNTSGKSKNYFNQKHDIILFYSKTNKYMFNEQRIKDESGNISRYNKIDDNGNRYYMRSGKYKVIYKGDVPLNDWWIDINALTNNAKEKTGYDTQKPINLLERIIKASSNEGDIVLDPFCGCGTTVAAAEKLKRHWIGIDIASVAMTLIKNRMSEHYPNIKINLDGLPKDLEGAKMLAEQCGYNGRFDFQNWIISTLKAYPYKGKGKDTGIDGKIRYSDFDENLKGIGKYIIISVKSGKNIKSSEIRDLKGVIEREKASGGIYVTLYEPTKDMIREAKNSETFKYQNINIPKIQICTVEDILNEKFPIIPQSQDINLCKKSEKIEIIKPKSKGLFD